GWERTGTERRRDESEPLDATGEPVRDPGWVRGDPELDGTAAMNLVETPDQGTADRKSTRLNSSHLVISYAVFCLKKKKKTIRNISTNKHTYIILIDSDIDFSIRIVVIIPLLCPHNVVYAMTSLPGSYINSTRLLF